MIAIIFPCVMKSHVFAMFLCNFTTTSLSTAEILIFSRPYLRSRYWYSVASVVVVVVVVCYVMYCG